MRRLLLALALVGSLGCALHAPPSLNPQATAAWWGTRAIQDLDVLRDAAIAANAWTPPLLDTATTRKIVTYHESAITTIHDAPNGWKAVVQTGFTELRNQLTAANKQLLASYLALVQAALNEVP